MIKGNTAILLMTVVGLTIASFSFENVQAQNPTKCQTNALIGVGGVIFGVCKCMHRRVYDKRRPCNELPSKGGLGV